MTATLEIHANVPFETVEEARVIGQALEHMLRIKGKRTVRLYQNEEGVPFARREEFLYLPEPPQNVTRGKQEVETRLNLLVKNIRKTISDIPAATAIEEGVMMLEGPQWRIDYQRLFDNVKSALDGENDGVKEAFNAAVATALQQEATGRLQ